MYPFKSPDGNIVGKFVHIAMQSPDENMYPWYQSLNLQMVILFPVKCVHIAVQSPDENSFAVLTACTPTVTNHINHISILHIYIILFID